MRSILVAVVVLMMCAVNQTQAKKTVNIPKPPLPHDAVTLTGKAEPPAGRLVIWHRAPAGKWDEGMPLGNGRIGAMVLGRVVHERIGLNESTLWGGGPYEPANPEALAALPEARKLVFEGKYKEAAKLVDEKMMAIPLRQLPYQAAGDLELKFPDVSEVADYRRELDLEASLSRVSYQAGGVKYARECFASAPDQVIVLRLSADKPGKIEFVAKLTSQQQVTTKAENGLLVMDGIGGEAMGLKGVTKFQVRVQVQAKGGTVSAADSAVTVRGADSAVLLVSLATSYTNYKDVSGDADARAKVYMAKAGDKSFEQLLADHQSDYRKLFGRVELNVGSTDAKNRPTNERVKSFADNADPQLAELYFQFGRYLLISSSRPGGQPANLQGIWNESLTPPWDSKWTVNINTEMNYWPAEVTNLAECHEPLIQMVNELVEPGSRVAKVNWNARGWLCNHNTDIWRGTAPINASGHGFWPTGGAWLCKHLYEHYLFGGDKAYLAKVYPVMKGAAEFFVDTLVEEPRHKWLVTCPSASPEHAHPYGTGLCAGPTMDQQIIRDLFANCIAASEALDTDKEFRETLRKTRERLAPNQIGAQGQLQEWLEDWDAKAPDIHHRHVSHLFGLFPGVEITRRGTPEFFAAVKKTLEIRGDGGTGWSKAWKVCLWARLEDGDHAFKMFSELITKSTHPNLLDVCPPFQIDGNFGACAGLAEMLLQTQTGEVHLLPALPSAWPTGSVKGLRGRGGFELDIAWKDGKLAQAVIRSKLGSPCRLRYGEKTADLKIPAGGEAAVNGELAAK